MEIDQKELLEKLELYKNNMSEFYEEEMEYLIKLVKEDINE